MTTDKKYTEAFQNLQKVDYRSLPPEDKIGYLETLESTYRLAARETFYLFVRKAIKEVIPEDFKDGVHLRIMCEEFERVYYNIKKGVTDGRKLRLSVPPGSTKTVLGAILFPAWCLGNNPHWRIIAIAANNERAEKQLGKPTKDLVQTETFRRIFPKFKTDRTSTASAYWETDKKGYYFARSVGAGITGYRANLVISDDIVTEQTAYSKTLRDAVNDWYIRGLRTRKLPEAGEINILTRWNLKDPAGYLEEKDANSQPWRVIAIPAILDQKTVDRYQEFLGDEFDPEKYFVGGSYWPEYKTVEGLIDFKDTMPAHEWSALYQQNPVPDQGAIFKQNHFKSWGRDVPPDVTQIIVSMDTAFTETERRDAAKSAYSVWGIFPREEQDSRGRTNVVGNMILLKCESGHWSYAELLSKVEDINYEYRNEVDLYLIEKKATGISLIQDLRARGYPVAEYMPDKSKEARAWAATAMCEGGRVWINPNLLFAKEFLAEVMAFPYGEYNDLVDTFSMAVLWLRENMGVIPEAYTVYDTVYDEDIPTRSRPSTYWGSVSRH